MPTTPPDGVAIPAPRGAAEPIRTCGHALDGPREVCDEPGWLSLLDALDRFAAHLVARYEHELCRAAPERAGQLRHQIQRARQLEATTAATVESTRRARVQPTGRATRGPRG